MNSTQQKIHILSDDLINKIAAGEVVERPASVVKELVENSIDAGATEITVIVKEGGRSLIQVVDNGAGMSREDAILAFQRHATSKIATAADLEAIRTLGFRGEALASIASVSRVEMRTMAAGASEATWVQIEGATEPQVSIGAGTPGTNIAVKNLFFNTPGRRKFLKSATTEYRQILAVMYRFAIAFPAVQYTFVHEDEIIFDMPPAASLTERVVTLFGSRLRDALIEITEKSPAVEISGVVGKQSTIRQARGEQYLYLNNRYINDKSLNHAVISAYGEILAHGGFPFYAVFLQVDPSRVDVNVHPSKMEAKFVDDRLIYAILRNTVRRALSSAAVIPTETNWGYAIPEVNWPSSPETQATENAATTLQLSPPPPNFRVQHPGRQLGLKLPPPPPAMPPSHITSPPTQIHSEEPGESRVESSAPVWQIHNRYLLSPTPAGLMIIDQHVAHERILYEQALETFEKQNPAPQQLLFPVLVELSAEDFDLLTEFLPFLERLGFIIKYFGQRTMMIEAVPSGSRYANNLQDGKILLEIIDDFRRGKREKLEIRDNVARAYACHAAVRSGDRLSPTTMQALISQLLTTKSPYFCPHGRPVMIQIPLEELDKRFGRT
ncbi:MAG: DNA mismatch repair endonuclease MutL [candidate division KSB1 bacterium]|nr:DNA mismatch repair endonuclease MutL [candidate division KSB1 bacterium]MDZ7304764.1 DNA mismatch repair endonuclease MutL [candidate division KSB1 bacterium]MDZ7314202.1 DNA mismatch repair endonuclease MutL [candidate division KSB1 bacterium]